MNIAEEEARRRPLVLGLIIVVHLLLGLLLFGSSGVGRGPAHRASILSGQGTSLAPAEPVPAGYNRPSKPVRLSFDRVGLVGPSTLPPPAKITPATPKVAPPSHPS